MSSYKSYEEMHKLSVEDPVEFWKREAQKLEWDQFPSAILNAKDPKHPIWFEDGYINMSYNCVDRWAKKNPDKTAIIYESPIIKHVDSITYGQLYEKVSKYADVLLQFGVQP